MKKASTHAAMSRRHVYSLSSLLVCLDELKEIRHPFINLSITRSFQNQKSNSKISKHKKNSHGRQIMI